MRNRNIQRQLKKLTDSGISRDKIRIIHEEKLKKRSDIHTKHEPVYDPTPWEAVTPGARIVIIK